MLSKLASRNIKRQLNSYLIYFITIVLTVALIFAVNNVVFSKEMLSQTETFKQLKSGITALTFLLSLIIVFIIGYATSFMIRLRKREFGTYLTLGMTRKNILTIFVIETLIIFCVALIVGVLLGLVFYQGLMALLSALMGMPVAFASYSLKGLLLTIGIVFAIFFLSSVAAAWYLNRVKVIDLIHGDKVTDKAVKHPFVWLIVAVMSLVAIIACIFLISSSIKDSMNGKGSGMLIFLYIASIAVFVILLHVSASKSIITFLLKNKKLAYSNTNTFTLRQIGAKLNTNSIMMGFLAFLMTFAIIGANFSFAQKAIVEESLNFNYPFDVSASLEQNNEGFSYEEAEDIINRYVGIDETINYTLYEGKDNYLHSFTKYAEEDILSLKDNFIPLSKFNKMMKLCGRSEITLNGEFAIVDNYGGMNADFSSARLKLNHAEYKFKQTISDGTYFDYAYLVGVVPDEAVIDLNECASGRVYKLSSDDYDAVGLQNALTYTVNTDWYDMEHCDFKIRESARKISYETAAIFILGALYIAIVFVFMAMALLALKTLSEIHEDKRKYLILSRLGASGATLKRTLFSQVFCFFIMPFLIPLLFSIPSGIICYQLISLMGFTSQVGNIILISASVAIIMTAIYFLYFTATFFIAKKNILIGIT